MAIPACRQAHGRLTVLVAAALFLSLLAAGQASAAVCRVTPSVGGSYDGSSWAKPMLLQTALATNTCSEIWVKAGVYKPGAAVSDSFNIPPGVAIYGGFAGSETSREQRDPVVNVTILSGDIDNNDTNTDNNDIDETSADIQGSNSYRVVYMDGTIGTPITGTTVLDGFIITGGRANGISPNDAGGGLYCNGAGSGSECSPTLSNLRFSGNYASNGGAIYNVGTSSPALDDVTLSGNSAHYLGGAMYNDVGYLGGSNPTLSNVTFRGNHAYGGGALSNNGFATLSNVTFSGNSADGDGGAIYNFSGTGGASAPDLSNVILWNNTAGSSTPEIYNYAATPNIDHSVVEGSGGSGNWNPSLGTDGGGNIDADPLLGPLGLHGGSTATMLLGAGSSAVDTGDDANCPATDQRGLRRPQGQHCDIGAVEQRHVCRVAPTVAGSYDGSSWALPMLLQTALSTPSCGEVWVKSGVYTPGAARTDTFNILPGAYVFGGFAGSETSRDQRDPVANVTILSGDIDTNDTNTDGNNIDETSADIQGSNSYHVVLMDGTTGTPITLGTILDGFTITGGEADGTSPQNFGGGLYCIGKGGSSNACTPILSNLIFSGNSAVDGGALFNDGSYSGTGSPMLSDVTFSGNSATSNGGAIYNEGYYGSSEPIFSGVTFSGNSSSGNGGAIYNGGGNGTSSPTLVNVTFSGNTGHSGGAMYDDGSSSGVSSPTLSNVTFSSNTADGGGAMFNDGNQGNSSPVLSNIILWNDTATAESPEIFNSGATPSIDHSVIQGSGGSTSWDTSLGTDGGGNIDADPLLGSLGMHGGATATLVPSGAGSAVDAGNDSTCADPDTVNSLDQRGVRRPQGAHCDIGAVENDVIFGDGFEGMP